jgi:hypothetical protein
MKVKKRINLILIVVALLLNGCSDIKPEVKTDEVNHGIITSMDIKSNEIWILYDQKNKDGSDKIDFFKTEDMRDNLKVGDRIVSKYREDAKGKVYVLGVWKEPK